MFPSHLLLCFLSVKYFQNCLVTLKLDACCLRTSLAVEKGKKKPCNFLSPVAVRD